MPANVEDIVPITVSRSSMTQCGRADNDDNRPLISDDRPDVYIYTYNILVTVLVIVQKYTGVRG